MTAQLKPFTVNVNEAVMQDLKDRLNRTRWPVEPSAARWAYGSDLSYMKRVVSFWATEYDWRKAEAAINRYRNFKACVDGLDIHFIIERGSGSNPKPIILMAGPGPFLSSSA